MHTRVYAYTRIHATVHGPLADRFLGKGAFGPLLKYCPHIYNMPTVSTISRLRLLVVHSVYRLYPGKRRVLTRPCPCLKLCKPILRIHEDV